MHPPSLDDIANRLSSLGITYWLPVLHHWLNRFKGLECYMEPVMHPTQAVFDTLAQFSSPPAREDLAQSLSQLDFLTLRVRHKNCSSPLWDSRNESFYEYRDRGDVDIWQSDKEYPSPEETQNWLLESIPVFNRSLQ